MPLTNQTTTQSGGDSASNSRSANSTQNGSNRIGGSTTDQQQTEGQSVTRRVSDAVEKTTRTESTAGTQVQREDKAFTLSFSVKMVSNLPCEEIPAFPS